MSNLTDALIAAKLIGSGGSGGGSGIFHVHNVKGEYDDATGDVITPPHLSATYAEIAAEAAKGNLIWLDSPAGVLFEQTHNEGEPYRVIFSAIAPYNKYASLSCVAYITYEASTDDGYLIETGGEYTEYSIAESWVWTASEGLVLVQVEAVSTHAADVCFYLPTGQLVTTFEVTGGDDPETSDTHLIIEPYNVAGDFYGFSMDDLSDMQSFLESAIYRLFGVWGRYRSLSDGKFSYYISGLQYDPSTHIVPAPDCIFKRALDWGEWRGTL